MPNKTNITFGNNADFSKGGGIAIGTGNTATNNSNNTTTNETINNKGNNTYNTSVGTQYGNTNQGDGQRNAGGTYNFSGKH